MPRPPLGLFEPIERPLVGTVVDESLPLLDALAFFQRAPDGNADGLAQVIDGLDIVWSQHSFGGGFDLAHMLFDQPPDFSVNLILWRKRAHKFLIGY